MRNYVQDGKIITCTAGTAVLSGMIYLIGAIAVIATISVEAGVEFEGETQGVFELPKVSANTPTLGAKAYLLADGSAITTTATGNTLVGVFTEAAANGDTLCKVRLSGVPV